MLILEECSLQNQQEDKVKIYAMGGVGEIGNNMTVIEINEDIFIVDAGMMHPKDEMFGVDTVIPDITHLEQKRDQVKAIFLTHAHSEHIGGIPYLIQKIKAPIYGTTLTLAFLEQMLKDMKSNKKVKTYTIDPDTDVWVGSNRVAFFRTNHSIPDSVGLAFYTSQGAIVHTGDFKFDYTPVDGVKFDLSKLTRIGDEGVLCLLSDSRNAELPGHTPSESTVADHIEDVFYFAEGRVITALHTSNLYRLQQVINAAVQTDRKVALDNRYLEQLVDVAMKLNYLHVPKNTFISLDKIDKRPDHEIAIISTSAEGNPMSPLTKISNNSHKKLHPKDSDIFIYASSVSAGDEKETAKAIDSLMRIGVQVVYGKDVHVSGHASAEDLKLMLELVRPKYLIPIHGEFRMLKVHMDIAASTGMPLHKVFLLEKGDVVEFTKGEGRELDKVPAGQVLVDGLGVGDVGNIVLRDRRLLAEDGTLIVVVTLGRKSKTILSGPEIITRGFVYVRESEELIEDANRIVTEVLSTALNEKVLEWSSLKNGIRDALGRYLYDKTKRRPMILPIIMEI